MGQNRNVETQRNLMLQEGMSVCTKFSSSSGPHDFLNPIFKKQNSENNEPPSNVSPQPRSNLHVDNAENPPMASCDPLLLPMQGIRQETKGKEVEKETSLISPPKNKMTWKRRARGSPNKLHMDVSRKVFSTLQKRSEIMEEVEHSSTDTLAHKKLKIIDTTAEVAVQPCRQL